ncbi:MAG: hypothetical protein AAGA02_06355 [Bacteroidota bacterium]
MSKLVIFCRFHLISNFRYTQRWLFGGAVMLAVRRVILRYACLAYGLSYLNGIDQWLMSILQ